MTTSVPRFLWLERAERLARVFANAASQADATGELARGAVLELKRSGHTAFTIPAAYGGDGAALAEFAVAQELLGSGDASLALIAAMHAHLMGSARDTWPSDLLARVARRSVEDGWLGNAVASEPELGSPSRGGLPATSAAPTHGGWKITGRKTWGTGAEALDFLVVSAATPSGDVRRFVVPTSSDGVRVDPTWRGALSLRASGSHDIVFEQVFVPHKNVIPSKNSPSSSAWFWTAVAATYLGVGVGAVDALIAYAKQRVPTALGEPIATLPKVQEAVGRATLELGAARTFLHDVARRWDASEDSQEKASLVPSFAAAKSLATNAAVSATDIALRAAGGAALTPALPLERFFRDARAGLTHPPSDDLALTLLGKQRLGL
ncbi:acyl-CoA dehydrogenase family protein [Deinococcus yavapaiensis]|uniref:Alkylation response protein AidB-like acyl-CoA dehydrogenase n=1 Tax=Deinococcus yavapaiensis KR-236 TaxID=694435 RepID=A0A318SQS8_9DEIO|nr:acyl-CoA dehydrogenase family protein [Deinococcus yavapaiensis]PYE55253.1 alkylation response protein AidB-like acyl-CoA dehydrogenase [Deinococcus yavapaiensis KR-236]